jgi:hypothetical protein
LIRTKAGQALWLVDRDAAGKLGLALEESE